MTDRYYYNRTNRGVSQMSRNDDKIMELKKLIEDKKLSLAQGIKFEPVTNCSLELNEVRYNLNVLNRDEIIYLLLEFNMLLISAKDLGLDKEYKVSGYTLDDWITDLKVKLEMTMQKSKEAELLRMERKLDKLLSDDKRVELTLNDIENELKL